MFFVIDKSKIVSYIIATCTVIILFVAAGNINKNSQVNNTVVTSTNIVSINNIDNEIITNNIENNITNN